MPRNLPLERDILQDIRSVFARIPWLLIWHNKERNIETADGHRMWMPGLCEGSADMIGILQVEYPAETIRGYGVAARGVFLAIETKQPGKKPRPEQTAFLERVRAMGGVAGWVSSVAGAVDLVYAARGYREEDLAELNAACAAVAGRRAKALRPVVVR